MEQGNNSEFKARARIFYSVRLPEMNGVRHPSEKICVVLYSPAAALVAPRELLSLRDETVVADLFFFLFDLAFAWGFLDSFLLYTFIWYAFFLTVIPSP